MFFFVIACIRKLCDVKCTGFVSKIFAITVTCNIRDSVSHLIAPLSRLFWHGYMDYCY
jgi:hypothetical protein